MNYSVSAIIPLYNKESSIVNTIKELSKYFKENQIEYEIIIVENESTDNSKQIVENFLNENYEEINLYFSEKGLGYALKKGIDIAKNDIVWFVPADLLFGTSDIEYYLKNNIFPNIAACSRAHPSSTSNRPFLRKIISYIFNVLKKLFLNNNLKDTQGAFIGASNVLKHINDSVISNNFFFQTELLIRCLDSGHSVIEIPVCELEVTNNKSTINFKKDTLIFFVELINFSFRRNK